MVENDSVLLYPVPPHNLACLSTSLSSYPLITTSLSVSNLFLFVPFLIFPFSSNRQHACFPPRRRFLQSTLRRAASMIPISVPPSLPPRLQFFLAYTNLRAVRVSSFIPSHLPHPYSRRSNSCVFPISIISDFLCLTFLVFPPAPLIPRFPPSLPRQCPPGRHYSTYLISFSPVPILIILINLSSPPLPEPSRPAPKKRNAWQVTRTRTGISVSASFSYLSFTPLFTRYLFLS